MDGLFECHGAAMSSALDLLLREQREPALDLVEPGGRDWGEMHMQARVTSEPSPHRTDACEKKACAGASG